jgi:phosphopantothenoylcysteine decarboxylase
MNTVMWDDAITEQHIVGIGYRKTVYLVPPIKKTLACGDHGVGAMAEVNDIAEAVSWFIPVEEEG